MPIMTINTPGLKRAVLDASNKTGTPTFVLAGMYAAGFHGDPLTIARELKYWFNATGGTSWKDALAAYHAGNVRGVTDPHALRYALGVLNAAQHAPGNLVSAFGVGDALTLAGLEIAGGVALFGGAAATTGDLGATAAAEGGASAGEAGAAGAAGGGAAGGVATKLATSGLAGLLGLTTDWSQLMVRALEALAGIALLLLGLQALTGQGTGNPLTAARKVARV